MGLAPIGYGTLRAQKTGPREWVVEEFWHTPYGTVPAGFKFDGASSPRLTWFIADPATEFFEAACIHDFLYRYAVLGDNRQGRARADKAFYKTALAYGAGRVRAWLAYTAVKTAGWIHYGTGLNKP